MDRLTVAELFALTRHTALQEQQRAKAMEIEGELRAQQERRAREAQLASMRAQSDALLSRQMTEAGVPGSGMMLARQGLSPQAVQMAASMAGRHRGLGWR
jgi:hypothetical protein